MSFKRIAIIIVLLVALGAVTLFILDNTIFAPVTVGTGAPSAPTLFAASTSDPGNAASVDASDSADSVLYRIDTARSQVRYEVNETLFNENNRLNTAIGRTHAIAGDVLVDFTQPASSQIGEIVIDISQFTSDESRRDNFIRRSWLESARYPQAIFVPTSIDGLPAQVNVGDQVSFNVSGNLTVKQTTLPITWNMTLRVEDDQLIGSATTQILMSDFGVGPIELPILATEDEVQLIFDFVATPVHG